jgi:uncharacterized repeat protein (TIGR01451 family)
MRYQKVFKEFKSFDCISQLRLPRDAGAEPMSRRSPLIPVLFFIVVLAIGPALVPNLGAPGQTVPALQEQRQVSPVTPGSSDWVNVSLHVTYFYNDSATVSWQGAPSSTAASPYKGLYGSFGTFLLNGSIEGGVWTGNPGNATIKVNVRNGTTEANVKEFLNYTMAHYVRFVSWPSLSIFNFTAYQNTTSWVFTDSIASPVEFLNTTFYLVNNATNYLTNGFNATGITAAVMQWRIRMAWSLTNDALAFSYSLRNATLSEGANLVFSLGRAMGRTTPLTLTGNGTVRVVGPYDRMILNATPSALFPGISFPYFPIGEEVFTVTTSNKSFDLTVVFRQPVSGLSISRQLSRTELARGEVLEVTVTVINTGNLSMSDVFVEDTGGILSGVFALVAGSLSTFQPSLAAGQNITLTYAIMALQTGTAAMPPARASAVDMFQNEFVCTTPSAYLTIGAGMLPSEVALLSAGVVFLVALLVVVAIYVWYRRTKRRAR